VLIFSVVRGQWCVSQPFVAGFSLVVMLSGHVSNLAKILSVPCAQANLWLILLISAGTLVDAVENGGQY